MKINKKNLKKKIRHHLYNYPDIQLQINSFENLILKIKQDHETNVTANYSHTKQSNFNISNQIERLTIRKFEKLEKLNDNLYELESLKFAIDFCRKGFDLVTDRIIEMKYNATKGTPNDYRYISTRIGKSSRYVEQLENKAINDIFELFCEQLTLY